MRLSVALAQCGEFGFVLFSAAQGSRVDVSRLTALASVLITISMLATPFLLRLVAHRPPRLANPRPAFLIALKRDDPDQLSPNQMSGAASEEPAPAG